MEVTVQFLADGTMIVRCPYNQHFNSALRLNRIPRRFDGERRCWLFPGEYAADVMKLLEDYYAIRKTETDNA